MNSAQYQRVIKAVVRRVALHMGATGKKGRVIAVFTGGTGNLKQVAGQIRGLILSGYRIETIFSEAAKELYAEKLEEMWGGFPFLSSLEKTGWPAAVDASVAVVVPLLSLNTLSRVALLTADTLPANIILRALYTGVPVAAARNAVMVGSGYWQSRKGHKPPPALTAAIEERLRMVADYGGHLVDIGELKQAVVKLDSFQGSSEEQQQPMITPNPAQRRLIQTTSAVITASQVRMAQAAGADLIIAKGAKLTPLAREMAMSRGVRLLLDAPC
jgi:hypothetical protein